MQAQLLETGEILLKIGKDHPQYAKLGEMLAFQKDEIVHGPSDDEAQVLASHYAHLFNLMKQAGAKPPDDMLEVVGHELDGTGWILEYHAGMWQAMPADHHNDNEPDRYERVHAPQGGLVVAGHFFRGGTWIPKAQLAKIAPTQQKQLVKQDNERLQESLRRDKLHQGNHSRLDILKKIHSMWQRRYGGAAKDRVGMDIKGIHPLFGKAKGGTRQHLGEHLSGLGSLMSSHLGGPTGEGSRGGVPEIKTDSKIKTEAAVAGPQKPGEPQSAPSPPAPTAGTPHSEFGKYRVHLVDAEQVRNKSPEAQEFGRVAIHVDMPSVVPPNEIWIDQELDETEQRIAIAGALARLRALGEGKTDNEANAIGKAKEQEMRQRNAKTGKQTGSQSKDSDVPDDSQQRPPDTGFPSGGRLGP